MCMLCAITGTYSAYFLFSEGWPGWGDVSSWLHIRMVIHLVLIVFIIEHLLWLNTTHFYEAKPPAYYCIGLHCILYCVCLAASVVAGWWFSAWADVFFYVVGKSFRACCDRLDVRYSGFIASVFICAVTWEHWLVNRVNFIIFSTIKVASQSNTVSR